ncbi:uncharacterized protein [Periplaneta americana]|uniref:uncharacterized protein isoform X2 n=1 Tax=Periplaneta americana TaxID=6978 RepID=UPI0037E976B4
MEWKSLTIFLVIFYFSQDIIASDSEKKTWNSKDGRATVNSKAYRKENRILEQNSTAGNYIKEQKTNSKTPVHILKKKLDYQTTETKSPVAKVKIPGGYVGEIGKGITKDSKKILTYDKKVAGDVKKEKFTSLSSPINQISVSNKQVIGVIRQNKNMEGIKSNKFNTLGKIELVKKDKQLSHVGKLTVLNSQKGSKQDINLQQALKNNAYRNTRKDIVTKQELGIVRKLKLVPQRQTRIQIKAKKPEIIQKSVKDSFAKVIVTHSKTEKNIPAITIFKKKPIIGNENQAVSVGHFAGIQKKSIIGALKYAGIHHPKKKGVSYTKETNRYTKRFNKVDDHGPEKKRISFVDQGKNTALHVKKRFKGGMEKRDAVSENRRSKIVILVKSDPDVDQYKKQKNRRGRVVLSLKKLSNKYRNKRRSRRVIRPKKVVVILRKVVRHNELKHVKRNFVRSL